MADISQACVFLKQETALDYNARWIEVRVIVHIAVFLLQHWYMAQTVDLHTRNLLVVAEPRRLLTNLRTLAFLEAACCWRKASVRSA